MTPIDQLENDLKESMLAYWDAVHGEETVGRWFMECRAADYAAEMAQTAKDIFDEWGKLHKHTGPKLERIADGTTKIV